MNPAGVKMGDFQPTPLGHINSLKQYKYVFFRVNFVLTVFQKEKRPPSQLYLANFYSF